MFIRQPKKKTIIISVCGRYVTGCKESKHGLNVQSIDETSRFGPTNLIPRPRIFVLYSKRMYSKQGYLDNYRKMFESRISAGAKEKLLEKRASGKLDANSSSRSCDMEGHAKKCVEDIANWQKRQLNSYTKSQHHALMTTNSRKKK